MQGSHVLLQCIWTLTRLLSLVILQMRNEVEARSVDDCPDNFNHYHSDSNLMAPQKTSEQCVTLKNGSWLVSLSWQFSPGSNSTDSLVQVSTTAVGSPRVCCYLVPKKKRTASLQVSLPPRLDGSGYSFSLFGVRKNDQGQNKSLYAMSTDISADKCKDKPATKSTECKCNKSSSDPVQVSQPSIYYSNEGNLYISVCLCLGLSIGPHDISFDHWKEGSDNGCVINWSSGEKLPAGEHIKHWPLEAKKCSDCTPNCQLVPGSTIKFGVKFCRDYCTFLKEYSLKIPFSPSPTPTLTPTPIPTPTPTPTPTSTPTPVPTSTPTQSPSPSPSLSPSLELSLSPGLTSPHPTLEAISEEMLSRLEIIAIVVGGVITILLVVVSAAVKRRRRPGRRMSTSTLVRQSSQQEGHHDVQVKNGNILRKPSHCNNNDDDQLEVIVIYDDQHEEDQEIGYQIVCSLRQLEFVATSHDFESIAVSRDIPDWITKKLHVAKNVLLLCTEHFKGAFDQTEESTASTAGKIIYYAGLVLKGRQATERALVVPLILKHGDTQFIPETFRCKEWFRISSGKLTKRDKLVRLLDRVNECEGPKMNNHTEIEIEDNQSNAIDPVTIETSCW